jgi:hypothetical protein
MVECVHIPVMCLVTHSAADGDIVGVTISVLFLEQVIARKHYLKKHQCLGTEACPFNCDMCKELFTLVSVGP